MLLSVFDRHRGGEPRHVKRLEIPDDRLSLEVTLSTRLRAGDHVLCVPGDVIPCDGEIVDGTATVAEPLAADEPTLAVHILGSRGVARAGTVVLSDYLVVRVGDQGR